VSHAKFHPHPRTTAVHRRKSVDFSMPGLLYCGMTMFMGLAAMNSQANLLFAVFGLMLGVLVVSGLISRIVLRKLNVTRELPEYALVGEPTAINYQIENRKRFWPSISVAIAELRGAEAFVKQPLAYLIHAPARTKVAAQAYVMAKRRGVHELDEYQVVTSFPFGFVVRARHLANKDALLIYPAIGKVDPQIIRMCQPADTSGAMIRPRRGGSDEFYGVKEYRPGENPRRIYWRRSARTGTLLSKEMMHVSPPRILMLVDTHLRERSLEAHTRVERAIAMAASVAQHALEQGLSVGLVAWSGKEWTHLVPNNGKRHCRDILTALALLPLNSEHSQREMIDAAQYQRKTGTTLLLITHEPVKMGLGESIRGGVTALSAADPIATELFQFDDTVDFSCCMPANQQVVGDAAAIPPAAAKKEQAEKVTQSAA
jgi:uncharacterized protein (DUF58 family)